MNRRELLGALAAGLLGPAALPRRRGYGASVLRPARAPWTFRLDRGVRWTLAARDGRPVVGEAEIAVAIGDAPAIPLGALEHQRRFQLSDQRGANAGWQVVGTAQGVEVSAQFLDGPPPLVRVSARGLEEERSLGDVRFFDTRAAEIPALSARPTAWINGFLSSDPCRIVTLGPDAEATSHWALAILPGPSPHPTAFAFGVDDAGEGRFECSAGRVVAVSRVRGRSVGAGLAPATTTLSILPASDPLEALARLVGTWATFRADVPAGWNVRPAASAPLTEADVLADLEAMRAALRPDQPLVVRIGDGYQRAAGDWETNDGFPHGHRWLTDRIHATGFRAGLWLAPFLVAERSGIPAAHPDWLLQTPDRDALVVEESGERGGRVYALDAAQVPVRDYLRDLVRHAVTEWGYDDLTLDQLRYGAAGAPAASGSGRAEAFRAALRALREGAGRAFITAGDAPLQQASGLVDAVRIGPEPAPGFAALRPAARAVALRAHFHGFAWLDDPGSLALGAPLTLDEARLWATVVAFSGGSAVSAEAPGRLEAERLDLLKRVLPVAPLEDRSCDLAAGGRTPFPSWLLGRIADDWWMLAALNWAETPRAFSFSLADHGIRGPLLVYDVWSERRRGDVDGCVALQVAPRSSVVLALRRRRRTPTVIGSTRHVVQGLDLLDERWDAGRRTLAARSARLDDRPYAVTVALPAGFTPRRPGTAAEAGVTVAVTGPAGQRAVRLELGAPAGDEVRWEVVF